ncbi:MAG: hypothetical protein E7158_02570 [Firmicutes bacterium]|nr:hypothetical protein [Bacillota bacterium]
MTEIMDKEMENKIEYFKYARYLYSTMLKDKRFVIDGDNPTIGNIPLEQLIDLDFNEDLKNELCVVHATDFFPRNSEIISSELGKAKVIDLLSTYKENKSVSHRVTVHSTLNCVVKPNNGGDWRKKKFIVLQPFNEIDSEVCGFGASDTFFLDRIKLSENALILVKEEEKDQLDVNSIKAKIVFYTGDTIIAATKAMIAMGYKPQSLLVHTIKNEKNEMLIEEYSKKNNYGTFYHSETVYRKVEGYILKRDLFFSSIFDREIDSNDLKNMTFNQFILLSEGEKLNFNEFSHLIIKFGIEFNNNEIKLFNTHETIDRWKKYTDDESFGEIKDKYILNDEYLKNQFELYKRLLENQKTYEEANLINELLSKKIKYLSKEDNLVLKENGYLENLIVSINNYCDSFGIHVRVNGSYISIYDRAEGSFLKKLGYLVDDLFGGYVIPMDKEKNLLENIQILKKVLDDIKLKSEKYNESLRDEQESNIKR